MNTTAIPTRHTEAIATAKGVVRRIRPRGTESSSRGVMRLQSVRQATLTDPGVMLLAQRSDRRRDAVQVIHYRAGVDGGSKRGERRAHGEAHAGKEERT